MSWDGAGETGAKLFTRFRGVAQELKGSMTFFLSGIYTLPERNPMPDKTAPEPAEAASGGPKPGLDSSNRLAPGMD